MNIACGIEYDGTDYHGFQRQPERHGATVQGTLEAAIARISGEALAVNGAGRTDAGVHASGQVINFKTQSHLTLEVWQRALNAILPATVVVRWAPTALMARYTYHCPRLLDADLMQAACQSLLGRRDFGAFGHSPDDTRRPGPHSCIRTLLAARCERQDALIYCDFTADAFLTGMVRRMVGTLLLVGQKRLCLDDFASIVQRAEKTHPGSVAPPRGLCLVRVDYTEKFGVTNDDEDI